MTAELDRLLEVSSRETVAEGVVRLTLRPPKGEVELPEWTPGAHIELMLAPGLTRQYSLCGDPARRDSWQVAVLLAPGGRGGSAFVHSGLTPGAWVRVRGPRNHFQLDPAEHYLFIAGGIGITPILPMIARVHAQGLPWRLVYGGRTRESMAFTLDLTAQYGERVTLWPQDEFGLLDLGTLLGSPADGTLVYCCGPEPLLQAVETRCAAWPLDSLRVERFSAREVAAGPEGERSFEVRLARSDLTVQVGPSQTVLEAIEAAGVTVDFSCLEGSCGTCETKVLEGEVDHRDAVLSASERAANRTMMICSSRARSPRLVLDL
jgi:ferredoxin-NADP reductase